MNDKQLAALRLNRIGFVFQATRFVRTLDLADNVALPALVARSASPAQVRERARALMERMGVVEVAHHDVTEVSGGQLQRAALCRALIPMVLAEAVYSTSLEEVNPLNKSGFAVALASALAARLTTPICREIHLPR